MTKIILFSILALSEVVSAKTIVQCTNPVPINAIGNKPGIILKQFTVVMEKLPLPFSGFLSDKDIVPVELITMVGDNQPGNIAKISPDSILRAYTDTVYLGGTYRHSIAYANSDYVTVEMHADRKKIISQPEDGEKDCSNEDAVVKCDQHRMDVSFSIKEGKGVLVLEKSVGHTVHYTCNEIKPATALFDALPDSLKENGPGAVSKVAEKITCSAQPKNTGTLYRCKVTTKSGDIIHLQSEAAKALLLALPDSLLKTGPGPVSSKAVEKTICSAHPNFGDSIYRCTLNTKNGGTITLENN